MDYENFKTYPNLFSDMATCHAVYDFLENHCGVRWYGPGEWGTVYDARPTLTVAATPEVRRKPAMVYRELDMGGAHGRDTVRLAGPEDTVSGAEWNRWLRRLRLGGERFMAAHSTGSLYFYHWAKIRPDHHWSTTAPMKDWFQGRRPELFAKGYENDRAAWSSMRGWFTPADNPPPQPCLSEPGTLEFFAQRARDYFDSKDVSLRYFQGLWIGGPFYPFHWDDNYWFCKCPECQAQLDAAAEVMIQDGKGHGRYSNSHNSRYYFTFVNKLAREVAKTHPDRRIGALAYARTARHPRFDLEPNIAVQLCTQTRNFWCPATRLNETDIYNEWIAREGGKRPLYLWLYYEFPVESGHALKYTEFPAFFARQVAADWKRYAADGIRGYLIQSSWSFPGKFFHDQLELHLVSKLSDNPSLDGQTLIAEFFTRYYGAASQPMRAFYELVENTCYDPTNYPEGIRSGALELHQSEEMAWKWLGTPERMAELGGLMEQAKAAAKTDAEKQRVALFERGIWLPMVEGAVKYAQRKAQAAAVEEMKRRPAPAVAVPRLAAPARGGVANVDWTRAADAGNWTLVTGFPSSRPLTARLAHDGEFLYIRLEEREADPAKLVDGKEIYDGDDWEVMLGEQAAKPYCHALIGPTGRKGGFRVLPPDAGRWGDPWNDGWTATSAMETGGGLPPVSVWVATFALPLKTLAPSGVRPGLTLYGNFFRHVSGAGESLAWSANFTPAFHVPERFGKLILE